MKDKTKPRMLHLPFFISIAVFSVSMFFLWLGHMRNVDQYILYAGIMYAGICMIFLCFQVFAFLRSHVVYDEDYERVKLKVFEAEYEVD